MRARREELGALGLLAFGTSHAVSGLLARARPATKRAGGIAFVVGFLAAFPDAPRGPTRFERRLRDSVDAVHRNGRQRVIAQQCDLAAVADCERALTRILAGPAPAVPLEHVARCFEAGLAVGLVMPAG